MNIHNLIRGPGTIFEAKETLKEFKLIPQATIQNLLITKEHLASEATTDQIVGFRTLWALASLGSQEAIKILLEKLRQSIDSTNSQFEHDMSTSILEEWARTQTESFDFSKMKFLKPEPPQDFASDDQYPPKSPSFVVVNSIGDPDSADGKGIRTRYNKIIGSPLERNSITPAEGALREAILMICPWAVRVADCFERSLSLIRDSHSTQSLRKPILLVGEPGTGKSYLAMQIGSLLGRYIIKLPAGGTNDTASLGPIARGWSNCRASLPVQCMLESNSCDPCIIVDELDKASRAGSQNGSVMATLLSMLEHPKEYYDTALMSNVDLSHVLFVATANSLETIDKALLDRFTPVVMGRPEESHFQHILRQFRIEQSLQLDVDLFLIPELNYEETNALFKFFKENDCSLRNLQAAYEVALSSAFSRERHMAAKPH